MNIYDQTNEKRFWTVFQDDDWMKGLNYDIQMSSFIE